MACPGDEWQATQNDGLPHDQFLVVVFFLFLAVGF